MSGAAEQKRRARHIEVAYHEGYLAGLREGRPSVEALARALRTLLVTAVETPVMAQDEYGNDASVMAMTHEAMDAAWAALSASEAG